MRLISILILAACALASDIPPWILPGIAMRETGSYFHQNDLVYVDRTVGDAGERGPFQVRPIAFRQVRLEGERHRQVEQDMTFAQEITERYLYWLYTGPARRSWLRTVAMYNRGPSYDGPVMTAYVLDVLRYGIGRAPSGWGG